MQPTEQPRFPLVPGPVTVPAAVLEACRRDYPSADLEDGFFALYGRVQRRLGEIMGTAHPPAILLGATMVALWGAIRSCVAPGDRVLAVANGLFGEELAAIARSAGAEVRLLAFADDEPVVPERVEAEVRAFRPRLVTAVHCETPCGALNPVAEIGGLLDRYGVELYCVDAVASIGGVPLSVDAARIDLCLLAPHKCLAAPPGLGIVAVSPRAWEAVARAGYQGYDALAPFRTALPDRYFPYTHSWHALAGLDVAGRRLLEEGLAASHARHRRVASLCRERGRALGLALFPRDERASSPTVTAFKVPDGIGWAELDRRFRARGLVAGGNYGRLAGRVFRLGHMGSQAKEELVAGAMDVIGDVVAGVRRQSLP